MNKSSNPVRVRVGPKIVTPEKKQNKKFGTKSMASKQKRNKKCRTKIITRKQKKTKCGTKNMASKQKRNKKCRTTIVTRKQKKTKSGTKTITSNQKQNKKCQTKIETPKRQEDSWNDIFRILGPKILKKMLGLKPSEEQNVGYRYLKTRFIRQFDPNDKVVKDALAQRWALIGRMRLMFPTKGQRVQLLNRLAPTDMKSQKIDNENWDEYDSNRVLWAFANRFGGLPMNDLKMLEKGEDIVPEGMKRIKKCPKGNKTTSKIKNQATSKDENARKGVTGKRKREESLLPSKNASNHKKSLQEGKRKDNYFEDNRDVIDLSNETSGSIISLSESDNEKEVLTTIPNQLILEDSPLKQVPHTGEYNDQFTLENSAPHQPLHDATQKSSWFESQNRELKQQLHDAMQKSLGFESSNRELQKELFESQKQLQDATQRMQYADEKSDRLVLQLNDVEENRNRLLQEARMELDFVEQNLVVKDAQRIKRYNQLLDFQNRDLETQLATMSDDLAQAKRQSKFLKARLESLSCERDVQETKRLELVRTESRLLSNALEETRAQNQVLEACLVSKSNELKKTQERIEDLEARSKNQKQIRDQLRSMLKSIPEESDDDEKFSREAKQIEKNNDTKEEISISRHAKNKRHTTRRSTRQTIQESEDGAQDTSIEPDISQSLTDHTKQVLEGDKKGNALKPTNDDILLPDCKFPCHPGNELYRETVKCFHLQRDQESNCEIVQEILRHISGYGGRFLKSIGPNQWEELTEEVAQRKIKISLSQMLRRHSYSEPVSMLNPTNKDILTSAGAGGATRFNAHPGNKRYRETVKCFHLQRKQGEQHRKVAQEVQKHISGYGGRFLKFAGPNRWVELTEDSALRKIENALYGLSRNNGDSFILL